MRLKKVILYSFTFIGLASCSLEKSYTSPIGNTLVPYGTEISSEYSAGVSYDNIEKKSEVIYFASQLTNLLSSFPKVENVEINKEVANLKREIKNYVYALQEYNIVAKEKALFKIENSYQKIQRLRKNLPPEENDLINHYLVRIKENIIKIELANKEKSISIKQ